LLDLCQRADTRLQAEYTAPALTVDLDLPGQVGLRIEPFLLGQPGNQERNDQRDKDQGNDGEGKFHGLRVA
jgi:hypothetical protein